MAAARFRIDLMTMREALAWCVILAFTVMLVAACDKQAGAPTPTPLETLALAVSSPTPIGISALVPTRPPAFIATASTSSAPASLPPITPLPTPAPTPAPTATPRPTPVPISSPVPSPTSTSTTTRALAPTNAVALQPQACTTEAPASSAVSGLPARILFRNRASDASYLHWLDSQGRRQPYGQLGPGATRQQDTYVGHTWVVADAAGSCRAIFRATGAARSVPGFWIAVIPPPSGQTVPAPVVVTTPPSWLGVDLFYQKYLNAAGIPIVASSLVKDEALFAARTIIVEMLSFRPDILAAMTWYGAYVGVMAETEMTTDMPEHRHLRNDPNTNWDQRARGLGGTLTLPITTGAEENLLCYATDRYRGESILLHEFAHAVLGIGIPLLENGQADMATVEQAYRKALAQGKWANTYAATNVQEYWAEGVQDWFDTNLRSDPPNGVHNQISTREALKQYDPALADAIVKVFGERWRYRCPE
ncbi:MAG: hypothetical protein EXR60_02820 [Dehalococcoidia bacterium]|nr:hypothetical protein [Dehalococcoidia bacterium]